MPVLCLMLLVTYYAGIISQGLQSTYAFVLEACHQKTLKIALNSEFDFLAENNGTVANAYAVGMLATCSEYCG